MSLTLALLGSNKRVEVVVLGGCHSLRAEQMLISSPSPMWNEEKSIVWMLEPKCVGRTVMDSVKEEYRQDKSNYNSRDIRKYLPVCEREFDRISGENIQALIKRFCNKHNQLGKVDEFA